MRTIWGLQGDFCSFFSNSVVYIYHPLIDQQSLLISQLVKENYPPIVLRKDKAPSVERYAEKKTYVPFPHTHSLVSMAYKDERNKN